MRHVGYTSIDDGDQLKWVDNPNWDPQNPNSNPGGYEMVPAQPEEKIGVNHVVSELPAIDATEGLATEGTTTPFDDVTAEFFTDLGFKFGSDSQAPWAFANYMSPMPQLYYEDMIGATLQFSAAVYTGSINTSLTVIAIGEGFDIMEAAGSGLLLVSSSNPSVADWAYDMVPVEEYPTTGVGFPFTLGSEAGEAEITVSYKGLTATAKIVVTDPAGIETAVAAKALLAYANGVITAEGCAIEVYDAQGRKVAAGVDTLSTADLATGLYIVRAVSADNAATMKIMVK